MKLYKAAEVCDIAQVQPYVLRSWEKEFPGIGVQKSAEGPRLYRQTDIDQVLRIKQLVFGEGLTLAGARRRVDAEVAAVSDTSEGGEAVAEVPADTRQRIDTVRQGLRQLLETLSREPRQQGTPAPVPEDGEYTLQPLLTPAPRAVEKGNRTRAPRSARAASHVSAQP